MPPRTIDFKMSPFRVLANDTEGVAQWSSGNIPTWSLCIGCEFMALCATVDDQKAVDHTGSCIAISVTPYRPFVKENP